MCDTPAMSGRTAGEADSTGAAGTATATARSSPAPSIRLGQTAQHALDVADRLREPGQGIVLVLLVLEAHEGGILHVEQRAQDGGVVDHAPPALDGAGVGSGALDVLHVQVVEALAALADG